MGLLSRIPWQIWKGKNPPEPVNGGLVVAPVQTIENKIALDLSPDDPLLSVLLQDAGVVDLERVHVDSPALRALREAGVKMVAPLINQGELIGLLNLGPRLSEQEYSTDDRRLINQLAIQAAPAFQVAQLALQQQIEARKRERLEHELRVARVVQQTLMPKEVPNLPGWQIGAHWQPARVVSGDFYDFIHFPDGKLGIVIADVTDKGVPAALVMATTRTILRITAERLVSPGQVLAETNNLLCPDMPPNMFVTCQYAVLDPAHACLKYANAGHPWPYQRTSRGVLELGATGMPLGLLPGMAYEEKETTFEPGDSLVLYSDGLIEAHDPSGEMFGFPRLRKFLAEIQGNSTLVQTLLDELSRFTGPAWEQEDDVTVLTINYMEASMGLPTPLSESNDVGEENTRHILAEFAFPSQPGGERTAMEKVIEAIGDVGLSPVRLERLRTAVAEGILNAMEHGNNFRPEVMAVVRVLRTKAELIIQIVDEGGGKKIQVSSAPSLEAKLEGLQSPRGWGLFLIKNMVDEMNITSDEKHHTLELIVKLDGGGDGKTTLSS